MLKHIIKIIIYQPVQYIKNRHVPSTSPVPLFYGLITVSTVYGLYMVYDIFHVIRMELITFIFWHYYLSKEMCLGVNKPNLLMMPLLQSCILPEDFTL